MPNDEFADLENFLAGISKNAIKPRPKTLFSLGARGYWENPTSDLLAFFMRPNEEHGFGPHFLRAFLECCSEHKDLSLDQISISREVPTNEGRIDILVTGNDWVLVIENKIRAGIEHNPLPSYEAYAKGLHKNTVITAILSPNGMLRLDCPAWQSVTYNNYLDKLNPLKSNHRPDSKEQKWTVFAEELLIHLKNEIYQTMPELNDTQIDIAEKHLQAIADVKRLSAAYEAWLIDKITKRLAEVDPTHRWNVWSAGWTLMCKGESSPIQLMLETPEHARHNDPVSDARYFRVGAWLHGFNQEQADIVTNACGGEPDPDGGTFGCDVPGIENRKDALDMLCKLAGKIRDVKNAD